MTKFEIKDLFFYKYGDMIVRNRFFPRDVKFEFPRSLNEYTERYLNNVKVTLINENVTLEFKLIKGNWQVKGNSFYN